MKQMRKWLASLLCAAILTGLLPTGALAAEEVPEGYIRFNGDVVLGADGVVQAGTGLPDGVTYSASDGILTLNNVSLTSLEVRGINELTLNVVGENNTITYIDDTPSDMVGDAALRLDDFGSVTIQGSGKLSVVSDQNALLGYPAERAGQLTITDGTTVDLLTRSGYWQDKQAQLTGFAGYAGSADLEVTGNATLAANGSWMGIVSSGNIRIGDGGTVSVNRIHMHGNDQGQAEGVFAPTTLQVSTGGTLDVNPREHEEQDVFFFLLDNSHLLLDGGTIITHSDRLLDCRMEGLRIGQGCSATVQSGLFVGDAYNGNLIMVDSGGIFSQTGGEIRLSAIEGTTSRQGDDFLTGLEVQGGGQAAISAGTFVTNGLDHAIVLGDNLVISGSATEISLKNGRDAAVLLHPAGALTVLDGEFTAASTGAPALLSEGGLARFLGGASVLTGDHHAAADLRGNRQMLTMGAGMYALDESGHEVTYQVDSNNGTVFYPASPLIIGSTPGSEPYAALLELTTLGRVTAGASFQARMILALEAPGSVAFTLPDGISLLDGSVTVNGQTAACTGSGNTFTVQVKNGDIVRFSAMAASEGQYTIQASVTAGEVHQESLAVNVSALDLSLPTQVSRLTIPVSGSAVAGSTVTLYDGQSPAGTATASSLGTWHTELTISDTEGDHQITAVVSKDGQTLAQSSPFTLNYAPSNAEVATLTIRNWVHGRTSADPPVEETAVINYQEGTRSKNYYTYWSDMPTFTFEVTFVGSTGLPDRVSNVAVVTTDWQGVETTVPLTYDNATGRWMGTHDFDGVNSVNPDEFRVEWDPLGTGIELPDEQPVEIPEPEEVIEDESDGAFVTISESEAFAFSVPEGSSLTLTDSAGTVLDYETDASGQVSYDYQPGELYVARLDTGTFPDHPGYDTLYILVDGAAQGHTQYTYTDAVKEVDPAGLSDWTETTFTAAGAYAVGDVLLLPDSSQALLITGCTGTTYTYEDAGLEDIYQDLSVNEVDMDGELVLEEYSEEMVIQAFLASDTYAAYQDALETYAANHSATIHYNGDGWSIEAALEYGIDGPSTKPTLTLKPSITLNSTMTTKLPEDREVETKVSATFTYELTQTLDYRIEVKDQDFKTTYLTRDLTQAVELSISVSVGDAPSEAGGAELNAYFGQKAVEQYLEELEGGDPKKPEKNLFRVGVPTSVPGLRIYASLDLEGQFSFFGELGMSGRLEWGQKDGFRYGADGQLEKFCQSKDPKATAEMELHLNSSVSLFLKVSLGLEFWKAVDTSVYAKAGPACTVDGHGKASFGDSSTSSNLEAELLVTYSVEVEAGVTASLKLGKWFAFQGSLPLYNATIPLYQVGSNIMPTRFQAVEEEVYVQASSDLTQLLDLTLEFQSFTAQLGDETIRDGTKIFPTEKYTFTLVDTPSGVTLTPEGRLTIENPAQELEFNVKVIYHGSTEDYEIWKIVPLHYVPGSFTIQKVTEPATSNEARFSVVGQDGQNLGTFTTSQAGYVVVPAAMGCTYTVTELACAAGYYPLQKTQSITLSQTPAEDTLVFKNVKQEEAEQPRQSTPNGKLPGQADPSGYVYEGMESNRLSGVTVTLYQAEDENGTNPVLWDASGFDQVNPLVTDSMGRYQWMVPNGYWWQVRAVCDDMTAESAWLPVPPIQTEVNLVMVSDQPAALEAALDLEQDLGQESGCEQFILRFDRPVVISSLWDLSVTQYGQRLDGVLIPADPDWSAAEQPEDSVTCATTFYFASADGSLFPGGPVVISDPNVQTYNGVSGPVQAELTLPGPQKIRFTDAAWSGDDLQISLVWDTQTGKTAMLLVAFYQGDRLLAIRQVASDHLETGLNQLTLDGSHIPDGYDRLKGFLLDGGALVPLAAQLER